MSEYGIEEYWPPGMDVSPFFLVASRATWQEAAQVCASSGATLATIKSSEENEVVRSLCNVDCWIGFNDVDTERTWRWSDGWSGSYTNWIAGEPNGQAHEHTDGAYLRAGDNGRWDDTDTAELKASVCRRSSPSSVLVHRQAECRSSDVLLGTNRTFTQCEDACRYTPGCRFFILGTAGEKAGRCYHEHAASASCPEGWQSDSYDFYELASYQPVNSTRLHRHAECISPDVLLGRFPGRLDLCAAACARAAGCHYFIFGTGSKAGSCWREHTYSGACAEGWEVDEYDFYELTDQPLVLPPPASPSLPSRDAASCDDRAEGGSFLLGFVTALALVAFVQRPWQRRQDSASSMEAHEIDSLPDRRGLELADEGAGSARLVRRCEPPSDSGLWTDR
jgi:hypothetical protein